MSNILDKFVCIDVETTGLSPDHDRIVEVGIALFEKTRWTQKIDLFVNPEGRVLKQEVIDIHGIRTEDVMDAPPFYEVYNKIAPHLYDAVPVGYNGSFDKAFLGAAIARSWPRKAFQTLPPCFMPGVPWIDVCGLARYFLVERPVGGRGAWNLKSVAEYMGFSPREAHRADEDAHFTGAMLLKMIRDWSRYRWNYTDAIGYGKAGAVKYAEQRFFWQKPTEEEKAHPDFAWLGKGKAVQVYECDVCFALAPGQFTKQGWTKPKYWSYFGGPDQDYVACSDACVMVASWHRGY